MARGHAGSLYLLPAATGQSTTRPGSWRLSRRFHEDDNARRFCSRRRGRRAGIGNGRGSVFARRLGPGFNFSVGFRRNFGVFFVFASYREEKFRYFSVFFVFKFKNSKIFIKNSKKYNKKLGVLLSK